MTCTTIIGAGPFNAGPVAMGGPAPCGYSVTGATKNDRRHPSPAIASSVNGDSKAKP
jgi:hypothetical protein